VREIVLSKSGMRGAPGARMPNSKLGLALVFMLSLALVACASRASAPPMVPDEDSETPVGTATLTSEDVIVPVRPQIEIDDHARAEREAGETFRKLHPDFLACWVKRLELDRRAHGYLVIEAVLDAEGRVKKVEATGGARLGDAVGCIVRRVTRTRFNPPHGGGTWRVRVPLVFGEES
jgi:hypothetical protein